MKLIKNITLRKTMCHINQKILFVWVLLVFVVQTNAQYLWFNGFSYNAKALLEQKEDDNKTYTRYQLLKHQIDQGNKYWLKRDYQKCINTLGQTVDSARTFLSNPELEDITIKIKHLIWERSTFAGRWGESIANHQDFEAFSNNSLGMVLYEYQTYTMMAKGDVAFIEEDKNKLKQLRTKLIKHALYKPAINIAMYELHHGFIDKETLNAFLKVIPEPIKQVGYLELYYYNHENDVDKLRTLEQKIAPYDYISQFRIAVELMKHYGNSQQMQLFQHYRKKSATLLHYLADADVDEHYNSTLEHLLQQNHITPKELGQYQIKFVYPYKTENRVKLYYLFNNNRVKNINDSYLEQLKINRWLLYIISFVAILFALAIYLVVKSRKSLRKINAFRHQFVFALSHDLNATLSELEWFAQENPNQLPEALLIEHRLMLNDTLLWAKTANQQELIKKEDCSFSDLVHECVDQLQSLIHAKNITINWLGDEDATITINKPAMQVAIRNVLLNAIKHNTQNGYINIDIKPQEVSITNSTTNQHKQASNTGSYLINYFTAINHAKYTLHINNQTAYCRIGL